eukprot:5300380-Pyramimonas_sp.AAC.1
MCEHSGPEAPVDLVPVGRGGLGPRSLELPRGLATPGSSRETVEPPQRLPRIGDALACRVAR